MRKKIMLLSIVGLSFLLLALIAEPLPPNFTNLLNRAKMTFDKPDSLIEVSIKDNRQMNYEYALAYPAGHFEVRYAIRPMDSMLLKYRKDTAQKKSGSYSANPDKLYKALFMTVLLNISGRKVSEGRLPPFKAFRPDAVLKEFNADWGAVAGSQITGKFGAGYNFCMVVAIHKKDVGNAYYFYLADSTIKSQDFGKLMKPLFHTLRFK